jgi:glycosyltransferase involved in cell wall biosynthesis
MRILFVHEVNYLDKVIFEMHEFPELLAERSHNVGFADFPESKNFSFRPRVRSKSIQGRTRPQVSLTLYNLPRVGKYPMDRILAAVVSFRAMKRILREFRPDVIVLYGVPTNGPATIRAAKADGVPVIFRAIDVSTHLRKTPFASLIKSTEAFVARNADLCLVNNRHLGMRLQRLGANSRQIRTLVPGFVDDTKLIKSTLSLDECDHDLVFMGTLFRFSGLDWLLDALATELKDKTLLVLGDGEAMSMLQKKTRRLGLESRVTFAGRVPFEDLERQVCRGRLAVIPFNESEVARLALPAKVFQYLMFGRATVATRLDGLQSVIPSGNGVLYAAPGQQFVKTIMKALENTDLLKEDVLAGQGLIRERFNSQTVIDQLEEIMNELINHAQF